MNLSDYPAVGTPNLAAEAVGVDVRTIRNEIRAGNLDAVRAGTKTLITRFALWKWLKLPIEVDLDEIPDCAELVERRSKTFGASK